MLVKGYRHAVGRWISFGQLTHSTAIKGNDNTLYASKLLGDQILNVLTPKNKWQLWDVTEVLVNAMV